MAKDNKTGKKNSKGSAKDMSVQVEDGMLVIRLPINKPLKSSASGKSKIVASTRGNKVFEDCEFEGTPVTVGVNAYIKD
jgi:hypothetical protein